MESTALEPRENGSTVITTDGNSLMEVISRAASDPNTDVDKLERLMDMYERITAKNAESAFNSAMTEAQSEMEPVRKDANNPQTRSKYATHFALDSKIRPIYTKHGFGISYDTGESPKEDHVRVIAYVTHKDGHKETRHIDMPADGKGAKGGDVMTKTHAVGSAFTYGRRYLLQGIFNIAVGDDDGNAASDDGELISEEQLAELNRIADEVGADKIKFCQFYKIDSLKDIRARDFEKAKKAMEAKR